MKIFLNAGIICLVVISIISCESKNDSAGIIDEKISETNKEQGEIKNKSKKQYDLSYFSGKAEINTYDLNKARYNGLHSGEAILIFVTEPFLVNEQVKSDYPDRDESVPVLKMNRIDRFTTGIYDYSIYTSVFTPTAKFDPSYPMKVTMSSQDWCGQSYMQLNNKDGFKYMLRSYFESEGDTVQDLNYTITEDNIFNLARIDTALLPRGEFDVIPTMSHLRLSHSPLKPYKGNASLAVLENQIVYVYDIPELKRGVRIFMDPKNHFQIVRWEETYPTVFDGKLRKSIYTLKKSESLPYWELNDPSNSNWRDSLQLNNSFD
jgi:hypothetical protein